MTTAQKILERPELSVCRWVKCFGLHWLDVDELRFFFTPVGSRGPVNCAMMTSRCRHLPQELLNRLRFCKMIRGLG